MTTCFVKAGVHYTTFVASGVVPTANSCWGTRTLSDYAQQVRSHYTTKVGSNSVRITAFVADLLKVNVARPSGFKLVNLVVCYHGLHKPEKETCRNKILID